MNYFPTLKSNFNHKFNNPLLGFVYDNRKYEDTVFLSQQNYASANKINKSKSTANNIYQSKKSTQKIKQKTQSRSQHDIFFNESKIFNITKRLTESKRMICSRTQLLSKKEERSQSNSNSLANSNVKKNITQAIDLDKQIPTTKTINNEYTPYVFPEISGLVLDLFHSMHDYDKICKIDLKKYFGYFARDSLMGFFSRQFIDIYQRYIDKILIKNNIQYNQQCRKRNLQLELQPYVNINNKKVLYQRLVQCQTNQKYYIIERLIEFYCLPLPSIRAVFMKDVLDMISSQLYQNYNCKKSAQYVFLTHQGKVIEDFAQIRFTTTQLFISEKEKQALNLERYKKILYNNKTNRNRHSFIESLKSNFRRNVAKGKYEESPEELKRSAALLDSHEQFQNLKERKANRSKIQLNFKQFLEKKAKQNSKEKTSPKILIDRQAMSSSFLQKRRSKAQSPKKNDKNESQGYKPIKQKIIQEFKLLKIKNAYHNIKLKQPQYKDKLQLGLLITQSVYFQNKTSEQINKILQSLQFIDQFDEDYQKVIITQEQYIKMRKIINCIAEKQQIINFVNKYLKYDDYCQIQKSNLSRTLSFIINFQQGQNQAKTTDVISKIIWNWLQKTGVVVNNILKKGDMERQYESNKLVYYFLISLIFGTNQTTALDMAQEILN